MQTGISTAYDDLTTGDAAVNIATSAGDITIDAQGNDTDIIFKGTDGNADTTFLTIDGSAAGKATFNNEVVATALDISGDADIDGTLEADAITINGTAIASVLSPVAGHASIATVGALDAGSITSGFGNIDNGASNITSGGLLKLDVDADANDVTGDSATGRLTLGAGEDLNLYHGGTDSYIVNDTGDLVIKNGASDEDILFQGNDGGGAITALTLDMSAAGAATFNNDVTAFSDARLKDNVETIPNALETVCAMRGVNFTRNDNNDQPGTGVIAQEMQEVFPVVVKENNDENNTLSVSYGNLVGVLIESIKELKAEIDELKGN